MWWQALVAGCVGLTAIATAWRQAIRPAVRWGQRMEERLAYVDGEMRKNGGDSMRDAVDHLGQRMTAVEQALGITPSPSVGD